MRYFAAPLTTGPLYRALNGDRFADETLQVQRLLAALALSGVSAVRSSIRRGAGCEPCVASPGARADSMPS